MPSLKHVEGACWLVNVYKMADFCVQSPCEDINMDQRQHENSSRTLISVDNTCTQPKKLVGGGGGGLICLYTSSPFSINQGLE